jgi:polyisoprenoid-binding protein YceI
MQGPKQRRGRRVKWIVGAVVAVPLGAVVAAYLVFFTPDSPPELRLSSGAPEPAYAVPVGEWSVGAGSVAGYRVREKLLSLPAPNDAVGRTSAITGGFRLTGDGGALQVERGMRIDVDVSTLKSDEDRRDDHMHTMAIESAQFPMATFVTTSELVLPAAAGQAATAVQGDLTLHGVTRSVSVPVQAQHAAGRIEVVGSLSFTWDQFDMKRPNLSYVTVESDPTLEFQLFFDHGPVAATGADQSASAA